MTKILVSGSIAYDYLMSFDGDFNSVLGEQDLSALSVSFLVNQKERFFGGCGANIAYNLSLLHVPSVLVGAVGESDFTDYETRLNELGVETKYLQKDTANETSSAYILSDLGARQIAMFNPGASANTNLAMNLDSIIENEEVELMIIGPENPQRMLKMVDEAVKHQIPFLFDPGQLTHVFDAETLLRVATQAHTLIANEFEFQIIQEKTNLSLQQLAEKIETIICTMGENGCVAYLKGEKIVEKAVKPENFVDATGCGDAFRAGYIKAILGGKPFVECLQFGNLMGSLASQEKGTQKHNFTLEHIENYYNKLFK